MDRERIEPLNELMYGFVKVIPATNTGHDRRDLNAKLANEFIARVYAEDGFVTVFAKDGAFWVIGYLWGNPFPLDDETCDETEDDDGQS